MIRDITDYQFGNKSWEDRMNDRMQTLNTMGAISDLMRANRKLREAEWQSGRYSTCSEETKESPVEPKREYNLFEVISKAILDPFFED